MRLFFLIFPLTFDLPLKMWYILRDNKSFKGENL